VRLALEIIFGVALAVISAPFAFSLYARRGERRPDRPGERSVVQFHGGDRYTTDSEREASETEGSIVCGEGIARAIAEGLRARGVDVDAPEQDDVGWGFSASIGKERAYVLVGRTEEEETAWIMRIVDPSSGGPGPASFRAHIDAALQMLDVTDVEWHRR
jgi:hypothetical protein